MITKEKKYVRISSVNRFGYRNVILERVSHNEADRFLENMGKFYAKLEVESIE